MNDKFLGNVIAAFAPFVKVERNTLKYKWLILLVLTLLMSFTIFGCSDVQPSSNETSVAATISTSSDWVAKVNDKEITKADLTVAINDLQQQNSEGGQSSLPKPGTPEYSEFERQVVERLADEEVVWFEAENMGFNVSDVEINNQIDQYKQQTGSDAAFNQKLQESNMTLDQLKIQARKSLLFDKLYTEVSKNAAVSTNESESLDNQRIAFETWFQGVKGKYIIMFADQYKPTTTATTSTQ